MNLNLRSLVVPPFLKKLGYRVLFRKRRVLNAKSFLAYVTDKNGLEIGGPSLFFEVSLPVYHHAASLDGVNFSKETLWEGEISSSSPFRYVKNGTGQQLISEATDLHGVDDATYDFVLSCHSLEHVANPLKALREWNRVLTIDGVLILVVPNKEANFDHCRMVTPVAHLIADAESDVDESDLTHLPEILEFHDLARDKAAGSLQDFHRRSLQNLDNRGLHHHVFDGDSVAQCVELAGFDVLSCQSSYYDHIVLCRKSRN